MFGDVLHRKVAIGILPDAAALIARQSQVTLAQSLIPHGARLRAGSGQPRPDTGTTKVSTWVDGSFKGSSMERNGLMRLKCLCVFREGVRAVQVEKDQKPQSPSARIAPMDQVAIQAMFSGSLSADQHQHHTGHNGKRADNVAAIHLLLQEKLAEQQREQDFHLANGAHQCDRCQRKAREPAG